MNDRIQAGGLSLLWVALVTAPSTGPDSSRLAGGSALRLLGLPDRGWSTRPYQGGERLRRYCADRRLVRFVPPSPVQRSAAGADTWGSEV
jgi:hypothetical protein